MTFPNNENNDAAAYDADEVSADDARRDMIAAQAGRFVSASARAAGQGGRADASDPNAEPDAESSFRDMVKSQQGRFVHPSKRARR